MNTSQKSPRAWLLGSAILNFALAGWIVGTHRHQPSSLANRAEDGAPVSANEVVRRGAAVVTGPELLRETLGTGIWAQIESTNYVQYVRNLRAVGCPESTIIDILTADVGDLFAESRASARETGRRRGDPQKAVAAEVAALERQEAEVLTALLGESWRKSRRGGDDEGWVGLDWMSLNTADRVRSIEDRVEVEAEAVRAKARVAVTAEDRLALEEIERRRRQELLGVLGAEGLSEYLFETSGSAEVLASLPGIQFAGRSEMRRVFEIESNAERELEGQPEDDTRVERQREVEARKVGELKALLGDQRYAQLERARDFRFQQLHEVSERFGLGDAVAQAIYEKHRAPTAEGQTDPSWVSALPDTARAEVQALLGDQAFAVYTEVARSW